MTKELPKAYDFNKTEDRLYRWWWESGYFKPSNDPNQPDFDSDRKPFVISIPPANVTGRLHLGHAIVVSLQDLMIRYHRMKGEPSLWIPGVDHAGIATQNVIEKALREEGKTRHDIGREAFVRFLHARVENRVATTEDCLDTLAEVVSPEARDQLEAALRRR